MNGSCKNAEAGSPHAQRPTPYPGPRCATCHREYRREVSLRNRRRRVEVTFNIAPDVYDAILAAQGGTCAICQRASGVTAMRKGRRRLAVDHDHGLGCCPGPTSCGQCVRGILCSGCNSMLAHLRDDPEAFIRAAQYLRRPPAQAVILSLS